MIRSFMLSVLVLAAAISRAENYDVVVYGGTCAGVTAAIQASKMGKSVVLIEPGKHPRVTLTPTLALKQGKPYLCFSVQGGDSQDQNLLQFFLDVVEFGMTVQEAVDAPRFHHQWLPDRIEVERHGFPADVTARLRALGHVRHSSASLGRTLADQDFPEDRMDRLLTASGSSLPGLIDEALRWLVSHRVEAADLSVLVTLGIADALGDCWPHRVREALINLLDDRHRHELTPENQLLPPELDRNLFRTYAEAIRRAIDSGQFAVSYRFPSPCTRDVDAFRV